MRNHKRIPIINNLIEALWLKCSDLRYFQLLEAIKYEHNKLNGKNPDADCFYVEEDALETTLYKILQNGFTSK